MSDVRILLLEDSEWDRELITRELKLFGLKTVRHESTRDGFIEALSSYHPSIVLADYRVGSFDGYEALRLVREQDPDLPFILITGTLEEGIAAELLRAGADDYLLKDRLARLGPAINHALLVRELHQKKEQAHEDLQQTQERYVLLSRQLADREALLWRIFDTEPQCVKLLDEQGRILEMNRAGIEMLEASSIEQIREQSVYGFLPSEYRDAFREGVRRVFRGESVGAQFEIIGLKGTRRWMETNAVPLRDAGGRITGMLAITRDITEAKVLEEQFRQAQKLEAVGRLAGGVAHDFNNILTIIGGYATMTLGLPGISDSVRKNAMGIQTGVTKAAGLTKQLLAFSRKQMFQPRVLNVNTLLATLSSLVTRVIGEDIHLALQLEPEVGNIKSDPNQIEQIVMNLAVNARDAMPEGGSLSVETGKAVLTVPLEQHGFRCPPGHYVRISMVDTGTGMTPEVLSHIFEPFFTTKPPGKGTGLGLSTVYGIVQQNGGGAVVSSTSGIGTRVDLYFPLTVEPASAVRTTQRWPIRGSERILVVEDDRELRELVRDMLASFGYSVTIAENGNAAIELLENKDFDLILTDIVMPGMSGLELGRQIENRGLGVKTLYMTGYTEDFLEERGKGGIREETPMIEKPFTPEFLASTIRHVLAS